MCSASASPATLDPSKIMCPLNVKGEEIMSHMRKSYGSEKKAKQVFYASKNAGKIKGVEHAKKKKKLAGY